MFLAGALLLLPVASFAQKAPNEKLKADAQEYAKKIEQEQKQNTEQISADRVLMSLGEEGKDLLDGITLFRKYFSEKINDATLSKQQKINDITQQFDIAVIYYYNKYQESYEKSQENLSFTKDHIIMAMFAGASRFSKVTGKKGLSAQEQENLKENLKTVLNKRQENDREKEVLLDILVQPIGDINWVQWMEENYEKLEHEDIIKDDIRRFLPVVRAAIAK